MGDEQDILIRNPRETAEIKHLEAELKSKTGYMEKTIDKTEKRSDGKSQSLDSLALGGATERIDESSKS